MITVFKRSHTDDYESVFELLTKKRLFGGNCDGRNSTGFVKKRFHAYTAVRSQSLMDEKRDFVDEKLDFAIEVLADKIRPTVKPDEALKLSQAILNLAQVKSILGKGPTKKAAGA